MDSFYMTLPSNSSMSLHGDNTTASYKVALPRRIELKGDYEVALTEFHYPQTLYNFMSDQHYVRLRKGLALLVKECHLPSGAYINVDHLFETLDFYRCEEDKAYVKASSTLISCCALVSASVRRSRPRSVGRQSCKAST